MPESTVLRTCLESVALTEQRAISFQVQAQSDLIRYEKLDGQDYMVVPIIALVEGVITPGNSSIKELALASEFGKAPVTWNGRPITLNHPKRGGSHVSASQTPQIFEEEHLGYIFNSRIEDKKLKVEAWINTAKVNNAGDTVVKEIDRLKNGEIVEVSTGLFTALEETSGVYLGKHYDATWRGVIPDHLAILQTGSIGACSVEAGCGANRVNELISRANCADKKDCGCGCSHKEDEHMPKETNHVLTAEEKVMKAAVEGLKGLSEKFGDVFKLVDNASAALSDTDTRAALFSALEVEDQDCWWNDIVAVYADKFIYMRNWDGKFLQRTYSISTDGTVVLGSEKVQVRPETTFVPVKVMEETQMTVQPKANNEADPKDPATTEAPKDPKLPEGSPEPKQPEGTPAPQVENKTNAAPKVLSTEEYLAQMPAEMRESMQDALRLQADRRAELIQGIKANKANGFSDDELKGFNMATLEKLAKLGNVRSYEGRAGGNAPEIKGNEGEETFTAAPKVFEAKKA